jgi:acyl-CoA synthetase (AMP-forming)/AMP-acid ligase II
MEELRQHWRDAGYYTGTTLADEIGAAARRLGPTPVIFHSAERPAVTSLAELYERGLVVAGALQQLGVQLGGTVAIQVPNWAEGAIAHLAATLCGATMLPIVGIYGPAEVGFILRESRAAVLIIPAHARSRDYTAMLADLGPVPDLRAVVVIGGSHTDGTISWDSLGSLSGSFAPPATVSSDRCLLVYTSGTTAQPKGVQHSHDSLLAELRSMAVLRQAGPSFVHLAVLPSGHVAGVLGLLRALVHGTRSVFMDAWDPVAAAGLIEQHAVTSSVGAPVHLMGLLDAAERSGRNLGTLAEYMTGAASVPAAVIERAGQAGIAAYRCYGSSEHPTISSGEPGDPAVKRASTDGRIVPGTEVRIVDDEGSVLTTGQAGEITCRGPEQFMGYLDPGLNRDIYVGDHWLRTGDIGFIDADGYLTVTDRKKDIIVRGGENISSQEIEEVTLTHPLILDAAAVAAPDDRLGERVCVFAVARPETAPTLADLREHFRAAGLARQKAPELLVLVSELPRTPAGKVQKFVLRDQLRPK